ncbi:MAG: inositol monophosphatase family protein [Alphaproteobacteria bacterium]
MSPPRAAARPPIGARGLVALARKGGEIGLRHFRRAEVEGKADQSLVTVADREIERAIRKEVGAAHPEVSLLGEELGAKGSPGEGWALAVDPIDGTDAYVAGLPTWSISIGLLHDGLPVAGVVWLPAFRDLYVAHGGVLRWNGEVVPRGGVAPRHTGFVLAYSEFHRRLSLRFGPGSRKMRSLGSTAYHLALVARGAAEAAIVGRVHLWDLAAGAAMLAATGGELVSLRSGKPLDPRPLLDGSPSRDFLVAAREGAMPGVLARIRRR